MKMPSDYPLLFGDEIIDLVADEVYSQCTKKSCNKCDETHYVVNGERYCVGEIIQDLWRRWKQKD